MTTTISGTSGVTFPAGGTGNPAGTVVGTTDTQTLTNKTLTSPTLTTPNINSAQFATVTGTAPIYACRAWVNFDGTGTDGTNQSIRASGNVTSVYKNGTGDYTITFTTAMPDANYCLQATANRSDALEATVIGNGSTAQTASACQVLNTNNGGARVDALYCHIAIFR